MLKQNKRGRWILTYWTNGHRPGSRLVYENLGNVSREEAEGISKSRAQRRLQHQLMPWVESEDEIALRGGLVYFIAMHRFVKIGYTNSKDSLGHRLNTLQTGSPWPLVLRALFVGDHDDEHGLHLRFSGLRARENSEWFLLAGDLCAFLRRWPSPYSPWEHGVGDQALLGTLLATRRHLRSFEYLPMTDIAGHVGIATPGAA